MGVKLTENKELRTESEKSLSTFHSSLSSFHFHLFNLLPLSPTIVKNFGFISIYENFITQKETFLIPYRYKLLTI
jgi:hypothetical protein